MRDQSCGRRRVSVPLRNFDVANFAIERTFRTYLVEVDDGLPELVLELVEVPHTNLTEVTRVVLVDVGTVVVLTTGHTATTGRLAVLADTTFTGRDMATVLAGLGETGRHCGGFVVVVIEVVAGQNPDLRRKRSWGFATVGGWSGSWQVPEISGCNGALSGKDSALCTFQRGRASHVHVEST